MTGPLLVIGRETVLQSGSVDLVALARSGELLIIEFKTGPQNPDFRRVIAQLLDYGSDVWSKTYDEFEQAVPIRYFNGPHCQDVQVKGKQSLELAARAVWSGFTDDDFAGLRERLSLQLSAGAFHYVVVAQRFVPTLERTLTYLNEAIREARFYAVEVVRFLAGSTEAFEARAVLRPGKRSEPQLIGANEIAFLESISDDTYRAALHDFFELCRGLGLRFEWGSLGASIRVVTSERPEPITVAWLFPPGRSGWSGLRDLTLGYDSATVKHIPPLQPAFDQYLATVQILSGVEAITGKSVKGYRLAPDVIVRSQSRITEALGELIRRVNDGGK